MTGRQSPSAPARGPYAPGRERRTDLVRAAVAVIADRGLERVTFRAVSQQAGYPPSTASYFFASVEEIIDAAVTSVVSSIAARVAELSEQAERGSLDRDGLIEGLIAVLATPVDADVAVQFDAYLAVRRRPALAAPVARLMGDLTALAERVLADLDVAAPRQAARQIIAVVDGFTLARLAGESTAGEWGTTALLRDTLLRLLRSYQSD